ncbi:MAG: hypothetical protein QE280_10140 [Caulobacter sp.]|nr:hypothetical protein [Caulobacter sp.]
MSPDLQPFLIHAIRIPKSGSTSLTRMLAEAFAGRGRHYLPDTLRREASISRWQAFRLWRSQTQNLGAKLGVLSLGAALNRIETTALDGDLITGGHSDQGCVQAGLKRPVRFITLLRDPARRALSDYNYARAGHLKKKPWQRFDAHMLSRAAARYDLAGFLDYQLDQPEVFGDIACAYVGWRPDEDLEAHLAASLWDWATLEQPDGLASRLSDRLGRPVAFGRHNATDRFAAEAISAADQARVERLYGRDYELHSRCQADNG